MVVVVAMVMIVFVLITTVVPLEVAIIQEPRNKFNSDINHSGYE